MIGIVNISKSKGLEYGKGMQTYSVHVNGNTILEFDHEYSEGLSQCLRRASEAVEDEEKAKILMVFK